MTSVTPDCSMCNKAATQRCATCRSILYCSKDCQAADWKVHKLLCKSRLSFDTPPAPTSRRAIVFLESGEVKFTWETVGIEFETEIPVQLAEKYFGGKRQKPEPLDENGIRERKLKKSIELNYIDTFLHDGSEKNLAVCKVVPGMDRGEGVMWRGALVVMKYNCNWDLDSLAEGEEGAEDNHVPGYGHMDIADLRDIADYLKIWHWKGSHLPRPWWLAGNGDPNRKVGNAFRSLRSDSLQ